MAAASASTTQNTLDLQISQTLQGQGPQPSPEWVSLWGAAAGLRAAVMGLLAGGVGGAPDSVRLQAAKFAEQSALLYTADAKPPPPPGAASLAGAAECDEG